MATTKPTKKTAAAKAAKPTTTVAEKVLESAGFNDAPPPAVSHEGETNEQRVERLQREHAEEVTAGSAIAPRDVVVIPFSELAIFQRLEQARTLPEVGADAELVDFDPPEGCIGHFKNDDRRTMRIVMTTEGFAKQEVLHDAA